jgi:DNA-binding MarR family transcriptional regulator
VGAGPRLSEMEDATVVYLEYLVNHPRRGMSGPRLTNARPMFAATVSRRASSLRALADTPPAIVFVAKVVFGAIAVVLAATLLAAVPRPVTVALGTVLVMGFIASGLVARAVRRGLAFTRDNEYSYGAMIQAQPRETTTASPRSPAMPKSRFETPQLLAFDLLLRTASELDQQVAQLLRPAEVTPAQYNVLRILRNAGRAGLACSDVSERLVRHDPDVTRLLDRLEARGLVVRSRDTVDRRVVIARITDEGLAVLERLGESIAALHAKQFRRLDRQEFLTLVSLLEQLRGEGE